MPVLRPLTHADLDELLEVQRVGAVAGLGHIFSQDTHPFPTATVRARWAGEIEDPGVDCFAVVAEGRIAGFAATRGDEFLHFGTAVETWGSGLAGLAHDEVLDHLVAQGHRRAWLRVFEDNVRAVRFYERRGWRPTGERTRTTFAPHPVLCHYEKDLVGFADNDEQRRAAAARRFVELARESQARTDAPGETSQELKAAYCPEI